MMDQVRFYMEETLLQIQPEASVTEAAKYMLENKVGALMVGKEGHFRGIVADVDFSHKVIAEEQDPNSTPVASVMSPTLITLDCEETMIDGFKTMRRNNIRHLVITEDKKPVGILSIKDFANYYNYKFGTESENESANPYSDSKPVCK